MFIIEVSKGRGIHGHPRNLTQPLKIGNPKRKLIFQPSFFRGYVEFRGCISDEHFSVISRNREHYLMDGSFFSPKPSFQALHKVFCSNSQISSSASKRNPKCHKAFTCNNSGHGIMKMDAKPKTPRLLSYTCTLGTKSFGNWQVRRRVLGVYDV